MPDLTCHVRPRASRIVHEEERAAGFQRELDHIGHLGAMHFPSSGTRNREILTDKMQGASIASGATSDNPIGHVLACHAEQRSPVLGKDADFLKAQDVD